MNLLLVEMRRALRRRAIRVLVGVGVMGCVIAGVVTWFGSSGKTLLQLRADQEGSPAIMTDWWMTDGNEGFLVVAVFFLLLGAFFAGSTYAGGEWRAGTLTTQLTWEPRRLRLHGARTASAAILAFTISLGLQVVFLASFLPSVWAHGTTAGADAAFWVDLVVAMMRFSALTAAAAVLAVAVATAARNTAFAVISAFAWMAVIEPLIRALKPSLGRWLWAENVGTVISWGQIPDADFTRGPLAALAVLLIYGAAIATVSAVSFQRRDLAAG